MTNNKPPNDSFDGYLDRLRSMLRTGERRRELIEDELRDHVEQRVEELTADGMSAEKATALAISEFGDAAALANSFSVVVQRARRDQIMRICTVSTLIAVLLFMAFSMLHPNGPALTTPGGDAQAQQAVEENTAAPTDVVQTEEGKRNEATRELLLTTEVGVNVVTQPLLRHLEHFEQEVSRNSGQTLQIYVRQEGLDAAQVSDDDSVSFELTNVPAEMALRLLLDEFGLGYYLDNGVVIITDAQTAASMLDVRVYDISGVVDVDEAMAKATMEQLTAAIELTDGGRYDDGYGSGASLPPQAMERLQVVADMRAREYANEQVVELVMTNIAPKSWNNPNMAILAGESYGPGTATIYRNALIVRQTEEVHQEIEQFLGVVATVVSNPAVPMEQGPDLTPQTYTVPISGTLKHNGEPIANQMIVFKEGGDDGIVVCPGITDEEGRFEGDVPVGQYNVIFWPDDRGIVPDARTIEMYTADCPAFVFAEVKVGGENVFDWDLSYDPGAEPVEVRVQIDGFDWQEVKDSSSFRSPPDSLSVGSNIRLCDTERTEFSRRIHCERDKPLDSFGQGLCFVGMVHPGEYRISLSDDIYVFYSFSTGEMCHGGMMDIPSKFTAPETSGLTLTVTPDGENEFTFDLESDFPEGMGFGGGYEEPAEPETVEIKVLVTLDGQPLPDVSPYFVSHETDLSWSSITDKNGQITGYAPLGEYQVYFEPKDLPTLLPTKYQAVDTAGLSINVTKDGENEFAFDLVSENVSFGGELGFGSEADDMHAAEEPYSGKRAEVSGLVRYDGEPLVGNKVRFLEPLNADALFSDHTYYKSDPFSISGNGTYSAELPPGEYAVVIMPGEKGTPSEMPDRYRIWQKSELRVTVQPGVNTFDFELASDAASTETLEPVADEAVEYRMGMTEGYATGGYDNGMGATHGAVPPEPGTASTGGYVPMTDAYGSNAYVDSASQPGTYGASEVYDSRAAARWGNRYAGGAYGTYTTGSVSAAPAKIKGRVTLDGEPVNDVRLMLHRPDAYPIGEAFSEDRDFVTVTVGNGLYMAEVLPGEYIAYIQSRDLNGSDDFGAEAFSIVPKKYNAPSTSPLKVTIEPDDNTINFKLSSKPTTVKGTVMLDGQPLPNVNMALIGDSQILLSSDENGEFTCSPREGEYKVIVWADTPDVTPEQYGSQETTTLTIQVEAGDNEIKIILHGDASPNPFQSG